MRRTVLLLLLVGGCGTANVPTSPPAPTTAVVTPAAPVAPASSPAPVADANDGAPVPADRSARPQDVESATGASFGQPLEPGLYVFPDGLRLRVVQTANCDFDTSAPCFGGTYQADATFRGKEARVTWSTRTAKILGHTIEVARFKLIVRK